MSINLVKKILFSISLAFVFSFAMLFSIDWSKDHGLSVTINSAHARFGRPLTPVSVAGVHRRAVRRTYYGGAAVGAVAVGTYVATLPRHCSTVNYSGVRYYHCGSTYYRRSGSHYVVATPR